VESVSEESVSASIRGLLQFSPCELLLLEAGSRGQGQFGDPEEGGTPVVGIWYQATAMNT
jgi:hypothetical protein